MVTIDEHIVRAPAAICFHVAADVERWPEILPHYRRVQFQERRGFGRGRVDMAAWRDFAGGFRYPTWWVSEMRSEAKTPAIFYRHVLGITRGMDVRWEFFAHDESDTRVRITHAWNGPAWPLIGALAANHVIGPHFISAIASRTLAGVAAVAEQRAAAVAEQRAATKAEQNAAAAAEQQAAPEANYSAAAQAEAKQLPGVTSARHGATPPASEDRKSVV